MKKIFILLSYLLFTTGFGQVGIGTTVPSPSAELEVRSTTTGFLVPRLTQLQRNAINGITPANQGMMAYTTDGANQGMYFIQSNSTLWVPMSAAVLGWPITGRASTTAANYIGTTATVGSPDLVFKTANVDRMRILGNTIAATEGNIGIGTALPTTKLHLFGSTPLLRIEDGTQGLNKLLVSDANGVMSWASPGSVFSPDWDTFGNAATTGNFIGTLATLPVQDLIIKTNNTEKIRVQSDGNIRIGVPANAFSQLEVLGNSSTSPTIRAQNNNTTANTISFGIEGVINTTITGSSAIKGSAFALDETLGGQIGVLGTYTTAGAAVFGRAWNSSGVNNLLNVPAGEYASFVSGLDYGVFGNVGFISGIGVYGKNSNLTIGSAYGVYCEGNFATNGTVTNGGPDQVPAVALVTYPTVKAASVPTTQGNQLVYCKESPEMWFEDFGFAQLQNGMAHISLEDLFLETVFIDNTHKMHVVLQEQAESNGLYFVVDPDFKGFTVKEKKGGISNASFSYSIMAKRRFYKDHRFGVDAQQPFGNNLITMKDAPLNTTDITIKKRELEKIDSDKVAQHLKSTN